LQKDWLGKRKINNGINDFYDFKDCFNSNSDEDYEDDGEISPRFNDERNGIFHYCRSWKDACTFVVRETATTFSGFVENIL